MGFVIYFQRDRNSLRTILSPKSSRTRCESLREISMNRIAYYGSTLFFAVAALGFSFAGDVHGKEKGSHGPGAAPGFYIQIEMCHACAYPDWQKEAASALAKAGVAAFASDDIVSHQSNQRFVVLKILPLRKISDEGWPIPIYVGPFKSENDARHLVTKLPTILEAGIAKSVAGMGKRSAAPPGLENCLGNHCDLSGYFVNLIRVQR